MKISKPKISIVMPSFNQGRFIEASLLSILRQGYENTEIIVIDGGSQDNTLEILKKYDDLISYWVSEPDRGQSHALNKGFRKATGEILGWLNSDDTYCSGCFERVVKAFIENPDKKIVFGDYYNIDFQGEILCRNFSFDFSLGQFIHEGFHCNSQAMFWKKEVHCRFGEFDEFLHRTMDYDMILRFALNEGERAFLRIDAPLGCFRRHKDQKTQGMDPLVQREHEYIASKHGFTKFSKNRGLLHFIYRLRRFLWYSRRAGLRYAVSKAMKSFGRRFCKYNK